MDSKHRRCDIILDLKNNMPLPTELDLTDVRRLQICRAYGAACGGMAARSRSASLNPPLCRRSVTLAENVPIGVALGGNIQNARKRVE
jgi:hypothetical protein